MKVKLVKKNTSSEISPAADTWLWEREFSKKIWGGGRNQTLVRIYSLDLEEILNHFILEWSALINILSGQIVVQLDIPQVSVRSGEQH